LGANGGNSSRLEKLPKVAKNLIYASDFAKNELSGPKRVKGLSLPTEITMLLAALKLQVAAFVTVAGVNTDDITNASVKSILETLDKETVAAQTQATNDPTAVQQAAQKAFDEIRKLADAADPDKDALYIMGLWSRTGLLSGASGEQVLSFYQKAADKGQVLAKVELAQLLLQNFPQDQERVKQARTYLEEAEKANNNNARFILANFHLNGQAGYAVDVPKARKLLETGRAAKDGQSTFGLYQLIGRGVKVAAADGKETEVIKADAAAAVALLEEAATQQEFAPAMTELAQRLTDGDQQVKKDTTRAIKMYTDAGAKGNPFANRQLAIMHETGQMEGIAKDAKKALEFYQKAGAANDPVALLWLGNAAQTGYPADAKVPGDLLVQPNNAIALNLYRQAALGGLAEALFNVGVYYESGTLVDRDPEKAFALFHRAALGNLPAAMFKVAGFYQNGVSVTQDPIAARGWYQVAAQAGLPQAQLVMGAMSQQSGESNNAVAYFEAAAVGGLPQAMAALAGVYNNGSGTIAKNKASAWMWASLAAEAVPNDATVKEAADKIFAELSASEKESAKKQLEAKRKDLEEKRKGGGATAAAEPDKAATSKGKK
jgi:uncharacterized protein